MATGAPPLEPSDAIDAERGSGNGQVGLGLPTGDLSRGAFLKRAALAAGAVGALPGALADQAFAQSSASQILDLSAETERLSWAIRSSPRALNSLKADSDSSIILSLCLEKLVELDARGNLVPHLARSWRQPNSKTYVYEIRSGVRFWDGTPLTAADVAASLNQHLDSKLGSVQAFFFSSVDRIEATGPMQVTVRMKAPDPIFKYIPALPGGLISQKSFLEKHGDKAGSSGVLTMGTGPYRLEEFVPDRSVKLRRSDSYWGAKPAVRELNFVFIQDETSRQVAIRSGNAQGTFSPSLASARQWSNIPRADIIAAPGALTYFLAFNLQHPIWGDLRVRRAIAYLIDREGLVDALFGGYASSAVTVNAPPQWPGVPASQVRKLNASLPKFKFNLQKARAELRRSKYPSGFSAEVQYPVISPEEGKLLQNLAENAREIGINLSVKQIPYAQLLDKIYTRKGLGLTSMLFVAYNPDMANYPVALMHSKNAVKNAYNIANYKSRKIDQLLNRQARLSNPAQRFAIVSQVMRQATADLPYLPVFWVNDAVVLREPLAYRAFNHWFFNQRWANSLRGV